MEGWFSMKIDMWSPLRRPVSRRAWATWLAAASYSANVSVRPDGAMTMAGWSGCSAACSAAYTAAPFDRQARVEHVDQAGAHEWQRLILQVVAHECAGDAGLGVGEADLPAGAHVSERARAGSVHRGGARGERGRLERVPDGPARRDGHDGIAPAHLLGPETLDRGPGHELLTGGQRRIDAGEPA